MNWKTLLRYYGSKSKLLNHYPKPLHEYIIEPFAGGACYSLRYANKKVLLIDKDPNVIAVWEYLIKTPLTEVLNSIPCPKAGEDIRRYFYKSTPIGLKMFLHMETNHGSPTFTRKNIVTPFADYWFPRLPEKLKFFLPQIQHWNVVCGDYTSSPNIEATWYVDPPYNNKAGQRYVYHSLDFIALGNWCRSRIGQVIVCENEGATWLPFQPLTIGRSRPNVNAQREAIWINENSK